MLLRVSARTVRRHVQPSYLVGATPRYLWPEVEAQLGAQAEAAAGPSGTTERSKTRKHETATGEASEGVEARRIAARTHAGDPASRRGAPSTSRGRRPSRRRKKREQERGVLAEVLTALERVATALERGSTQRDPSPSGSGAHRTSAEEVVEVTELDRQRALRALDRVGFVIPEHAR
ncbi:MAG: hypothetical protein CMN31_23060 [Sandaracinus sp.]|nr:hypothetical protein [Myxococcales bacterium]MAT24816.1 hypothetical protein [Sandaracinus sp.]HJK89635.1 hypothetical protein [Polyangiaceae bacterium LLY-WYZ-15_(1-7)]MBJ74170.1 hypothetical protein [Sandaracinus sp.]HJL25819.1 hypothetical protein [Polyangiaceae bacterium LLY-WYZ-15_(1-7)]